jgi:protein-S-isoprenylcysteine O-methyltransferase Ste14
VSTSYLFLLPLLLGFALNSASDFTTFYTRRWGEKRTKRITFFLRNIFGIPVWAAGICLAVWTPAPLLFAQDTVSAILGWLLIISGGLLILTALLTLGKRAALPSVEDTLASANLYAKIRHPIYSGMLLELPGIFLIKPSLTTLIACGLGIAWAIIQSILEEIDLLQRLPAYRDYMQRVPRFIPRIRK